VIIDHRVLYFQSLPPRPTAEQWREDLDYLAEKMVDQHPNLFAKVSEEEFNEALADFDARMPELTDSEILAGFFEITAILRDGHTFPFIFSPCYKLHAFPLQTYWFDENLHIVNAGREHKRVVGARIVAIDGIAIEDVRDRCRRFVPADGKYNEMDRSAMVIMVAELLEAEGIINSRQQATFTLQDDTNEPYDITLKPIGFLASLFWSAMKTVDNTAPPAIPNDRKDAYWFELREDTGTLYFGFNRVVEDSGGETLEEFTERLGQFVETHEFDRVVIDIRNNDGGNGTLVPDLVRFIGGNDKINEKGRLFVLTGRKTFSAAVMFASVLANNTKAIFIGEPTGQGPNFYSVPSTVVLPNSKLEFLISTMPTQSSLAMDDRPWIEPDVYVDYAIEDFMTGRDPTMDVVLRYVPETIETVELQGRPLDAYTGRYAFSPYQLLTVDRTGNSLWFAIDDFFETSCVNVSSELHPVTESRFRTDIRDVYLEFCFDEHDRVEELDLEWKGSIMTVRGAPEGFRLPMELFSAGMIDEGIATLLENKEDYLGHHKGLEGVINTMGYRYLRNEDFVDAIKIFTLNVELFPDSWNVYDSLGEAYMEGGNRELAIQFYEKSLELNPENTNGAKMLKRLGAG
jgi:hypothetical protein